MWDCSFCRLSVIVHCTYMYIHVLCEVTGWIYVKAIRVKVNNLAFKITINGEGEGEGEGLLFPPFPFFY